MAEDIAKPAPLVITIEEAHKFLNPEVSSQTIFGTIAREMRKYNVTLLVIDQRPSGIDDEVISQMGTKITCLLDNERDVDSVVEMSGVEFLHGAHVHQQRATLEMLAGGGYRKLGRSRERQSDSDDDSN